MGGGCDGRATMKGKVYIVGAGPGDPELLTLKALRVLKTAEVVLHDDLVPVAILDRTSAGALRFNVGKRSGRKVISQEEIHQLMISYAWDGYTVVRLHGGDPLIFGRAGEEIAALGRVGLEFEIIPGITSALAAAASAQVPLTQRGVSSSVVFMTGHGSAGKGQAQESMPRVRGNPLASTIVVFMPADFASLAAELSAAGWDEQTPCLVFSSVSTPSEQSFLTTLRDLPQVSQPSSPKLLIIGEVVRAGRPKRLEDFGLICAELESASCRRDVFAVFG